MTSHDGPPGARQDPNLREGALLLSSLVLTPDSALERYRAHRSGDPHIPVEQLHHARELLDAVAFAIRSGEAARWSRIVQAWRLLRDDARRVPPPLPTTGRASPSRRPEPVAAPAQAHPDAGETAELRLGPLAATDPLPFRGAAAAPLPATPGLAPRSQVDVDETAAAGLVLGDVRPLPFENAASEPRPSSRSGRAGELTLEQYASLRAELRCNPAARLSILTRYRIGHETGLQQLEEQWEQRLAAEPPLRPRLDELVARYEQWLRAQRKPEPYS